MSKETASEVPLLNMQKQTDLDRASMVSQQEEYYLYYIVNIFE